MNSPLSFFFFFFTPSESIHTQTHICVYFKYYSSAWIQHVHRAGAFFWVKALPLHVPQFGVTFTANSAYFFRHPHKKKHLITMERAPCHNRGDKLITISSLKICSLSVGQNKATQSISLLYEQQSISESSIESELWGKMGVGRLLNAVYSVVLCRGTFNVII